MVRGSAAAAPIQGPSGVLATLDAMASLPGYKATTEAGHAVLLEHGVRTVGLEPGGQIELSGTASDDFRAIEAELWDHMGDVGRALPEGLAPALLGEHPVTRLDAIDQVPKARYRILADFLQGRGRLSHQMMRKTATVQASFDFRSVEEGLRMTRVAQLITPLLVAFSANSPYADGRATGYLSHRTAIWNETDRERCGHLALALAKDFSLERYLDWLISLPVIFIQRGDDWRAGGGATFRDLLARKVDGIEPTMFDWELHLSSVFPDVRMKQVVEVRGADCPPLNLIIPVVALMTGVLYGQAALDFVEESLGGLGPEDHLALQLEAAQKGFEAKIGTATLGEIGAQLLDTAKEGLRAFSGGRAASRLDPLREMIEEGKTPAERLLDRFGEIIEDPAGLVDAVAVLDGITAIPSSR